MMIIGYNLFVLSSRVKFRDIGIPGSRVWVQLFQSKDYFFVPYLTRYTQFPEYRDSRDLRKARYFDNPTLDNET